MRIFRHSNGGRALLAATVSAVLVLPSACDGPFKACRETRTCPLETGGELQGGAAGESLASGGGGGSSTPGEVAGENLGGSGDGGERSEGGGQGDPPEEIAPPVGAFAWYKATEADVEIGSSSLADGNEFKNSSWIKSNVTVQALQPDMDNGKAATALYDAMLGPGVRSIKHAIVSSSDSALKTLRIRARKGERRYLWLGGAAIYPQPARYAVFDLLDGVVLDAGTAHSAKMTQLKNLWYSCEVTLASGPELSVGVSYSPTVQEEPGPATAKPLVWLQQAEVDQTWVKSWKDRTGSRDFTDPNGAWGWVKASPELGGLPAIQAYYLYGPKLTAGTASDWSFLHDGTGGTLVILQEQAAPGRAYSNSIQTVYDGAHEGVHLGVSAKNEKLWRYSVTNSSGESLFVIDGGSTTGAKWLLASYGATQTPNAQLFEDGILVASANAAAEPSSTAGNEPLALGGSFGPNQLVHEVLVYDRALEPADIARLKQYFAAQLDR